jgi:hypothetical protein
MASPREILQQAIDECARIEARHAAEREEIHAQQRAALMTIPGIADAMAARDRALAAAARAFDKRVAASNHKAREQEAEWPEVEESARDKAENAWRAALRKADQKRAAAVAKVEREFEEARRAAASLTGPALDARRRNARRSRDEGLAEAERVHREEVQAAWVAWQSAKVEAQDAAIARVEQARRDEEIGVADAAATRDDAVREADAVLDAAVQANPLARSIADAFTARLRQVDADCESAKAAALAHL